MVEILKSIVDFFMLLLQFIVNVVTGLGRLLDMIPAGLSFLATAIASLPPEIAAIGTALVSISIVFLIIGR